MASRSRSSSGEAVPPGGVKICFQFPVRAAARALRCRQLPGHPAGRAPFQKAGSGFWQRAHNGSRSVPPFSGAPVPQRS
ncbi:MAG TPA: hypothetical protein DEH11_05495 [Actinobacteria bacterium]|jgi:hypothetical protein|nr:hypothetical protein [Actinomycetota bacterium]